MAPTMNEVVVDSWEQLQSALYDDSWNEDLGRHRSPYVFRGLSDADYGLETSLVRLMEGGDESIPGDDYENIESHLLRNFSKYAHREVSSESVWHLLSVAQHHGLPTRLLDWTYSPQVAAHFATEELRKFDTDGVIWKVDHEKVREELPMELRNLLEQEQSTAFTVDMLEGAIEHITEERHGEYGTEPVQEQISGSVSVTGFSLNAISPAKSISFPRLRDSLENFDRLGEFVVFFEPPSLDERIVNQSALFSVMSDPTARLDDWLEDHPDLYERIVIPAEHKPAFRDYLDQANVTERVLFPGLDGLADWLERYYTPKHKWESYGPDE